MKFLYLAIIITMLSNQLIAQHFNGRILDCNTHIPLQGALIVDNTGFSVKSDDKGYFQIPFTSDKQHISISFLGYQTKSFYLKDITPLDIELCPVITTIDSIYISTGYQYLPKDRATGSYAFLDKKKLNISPSNNILDRLEGLISGLDFDRRMDGSVYGTESSLINNGKQVDISIRGLSTINSNSAPLIVIDNFPYEGDLSAINPNDVESVSVLKDAAATSIWGARAGNGVIVITTRKGHYDSKIHIDFNTNAYTAKRPNLFSSKKSLASYDFLKLEKELFDRGFYNTSSNFVLPHSPFIEFLSKLPNDQEIELKIKDWSAYNIKEDLSSYFYRNTVGIGHQISLTAGSEKMKYLLSAYYDTEKSENIGNSYSRKGFRSHADFRPTSTIDVYIDINYMNNPAKSNAMSMVDLLQTGKTEIYPYARLIDDFGNALPILKNYRSNIIDNAEDIGLLPWTYIPLFEQSLNDNSRKRQEIRLNSGLSYNLLKFMQFQTHIMWQKDDNRQEEYNAPESYYVRDMVNQFTQEDGTHIFPLGGQLNVNNNNRSAWAWRVGANMNKVWGNHGFDAVIGYEIREDRRRGDGYKLFGYDKGNLTHSQRLDFSGQYITHPQGVKRRLPVNSNMQSDLIDRFISQYFNFSYHYKSKYIVSGSMRKDASNLFGVRSNQKFVPLWSVGGKWKWVENLNGTSWLDQLSIRGSYGVSGNLNRRATSYPVLSYSTSLLLGLPAAMVQTPANPNLRWEQVSQLNFAIEAGMFDKNLLGVLEVFQKSGRDLMGDVYLDPTIGFFKGVNPIATMNYADMQTKGVDLSLSYKHKLRRFEWQSSFLLSYITDKVTNYEEEEGNLLFFATEASPARKGYPRYGMYSYPWEGLDSETGAPLVKVNDEKSENYAEFFRNITINDMIYHGPQNPPLFGSWQNSFKFKGIILGLNLIYKFGHHFRRSSINYYSLFNSWSGHRDYEKRWQNPGDEKKTNVPSIDYNFSTSNQRSSVYLYSPALVERGDHLRLKNIHVEYQISDRFTKVIGLKQLSFKFFMNNVGIIWRANKKQLDPDRPNIDIAQSRDYNFSIQARF